MRRTFFLVFIISFLPVHAHAAVFINEIAWMGGVDSANHEWIELYNSGSEVNVNGWMLTSSGGLSIELSGSISSNSYAVLERTSDDSATGVAFLIYAGALKNTGETIYLHRSDGGLEDQVVGGENWEQVGGNNETKSTAQYTTNGWITASPTPGKMNALKAEVVEEVADSSGSARLAEPAVRQEEPQKLELPPVGLQLSITAPKTAYVNQSVDFDVEPSGIGDTLQKSLVYTWNFGDGESQAGKEVQHTFSYPGTYVVQVFGEYARQHAISRQEITVLPVSISLTTNRDGDIQIHNNAPYEIDLSNYRVRATEVLGLPLHTVLMSNQTITIPKEKVGYTGTGMIGLYDQVGELQASILPERVVDQAQEVRLQNRRVATIAAPTTFQFVSTESNTLPEEVQVEEDAIPSETAASSSPTLVGDRSSNWVFGVMIVLLMVAIGGILMKPLPDSDSLDRV